MAFRSLEHFIEETWLRYSQQRTQDRAELYRHELYGLVDAAMVRVGEAVLASPNSNWLQRSLVLELNRPTTAVTFPHFVSPVNGQQSGLQISEDTLSADDDNVFALSAERLRTSDKCTLDIPIQNLAAGAIYLRPLSNRSTASATYQDANHIAITWEIGQAVKVWQGGAIVTDAGFQALAATILRLEFDGAGGATIKRLDSGGNEQAATATTLTTDEIWRFIGVVFRSKTLRLGTLRLGQDEANLAELPADHRFLLSSIESHGAVEFMGPFESESAEYLIPLTFRPQGSYRTIPHLMNLWYWSWNSPASVGAVGAAIRVFSGQVGCPPPASALAVTGNVVPTWQDIPAQLHDAAVLALLGLARERALLAQQGAKRA